MGISLNHRQGEVVVVSPRKSIYRTRRYKSYISRSGSSNIRTKNPPSSVNTVVGETVAAPSIVNVTGIPANPMPFTNKRPGATTGTLQSSLVNASPIATSVPVTGNLLTQTLTISFSLNLKATRNPFINPKFCSWAETCPRIATSCDLEKVPFIGIFTVNDTLKRDIINNLKTRH